MITPYQVANQRNRAMSRLLERLLSEANNQLQDYLIEPPRAVIPVAGINEVGRRFIVQALKEAGWDYITDYDDDGIGSLYITAHVFWRDGAVEVRPIY